MKFTRSALLGVATATILGSVVFAASHANVEGAVKARQSHMQLFAFNLGTLGGMARGNIDFDADVATRAATSLNALAQIDMGGYWPQGSSNMDIENTRALPEIWENTPDVIEKMEALTAATAAMAENAGSLDGVRASIGAVGGACGACHEAYRLPD